jgi:Zn-dependent peptidase ImmA (M78 family)
MLAVRGPSAPVTPLVLRWARETAGLDFDTAASKAGNVSAAKIESVEHGDDSLTLNQARKLADVYERPFALLFLPAPPDEEPLDVQFRRLRDAPKLPWPPEMRALARRLPALQDAVDALFDATDEEPEWPSAFSELRGRRPLESANALREKVDVSLATQKQAARSDAQGFRAFRVWREAIENLGVLVIQDGGLEVDQMRGFVSPHERVPAIAINTNDDVRARLFTLVHELGHLIWPDAPEEEFERFAATVLMPPQPFSTDFAAASGLSLLEKIDSLARSYAVTSDATAVRVGWLKLASWNEVNEVREAIKGRGGPKKPKGGNHYRNVIARYGPGLVDRTLTAVNEGAISDLAAARLLGVRVPAFGRLRDELSGGSGA